MNPWTPSLAESSQRYLRRRANRRVRKARLARNVVHGLLIMAVNLAVVAALSYAMLTIWNGIRRSRQFAVEHIEISGAKRASADMMRRNLSVFVGQNLFTLNLEAIETALMRDPWVLSSSVKRVLPDTLHVSTTERVPCALAMIEKVAHLLDSTGYVIGPAKGKPEAGLPMLTGLPAPDTGYLAEELRRGAGLIERLRRAFPAFANGISEVDLSRQDRITVHTLAGGPRLLLDPALVERNMRRYLGLRDEMTAGAGRAEYVDLRWEGRITFRPLGT